MATQAKHTPGPWELSESCVRIDGQNWRIVQSQCPNWGDDDTPPYPGVAWIPCRHNGTFPASREANAWLIASAPDLLAACERTTRFCTNLAGQSPNRTGYVEVSLSKLNDLHAFARAAIAKATGGAQ